MALKTLTAAVLASIAAIGTLSTAARADDAMIPSDPSAAAAAKDPDPKITAKTVVPPPAKVAPKKDDKKKAWETAPAKHRGGFAMGLMIAGGLGASNGYPSDSKKIGREDYYTESGLGFMGAPAGWIGGALADWLTFGLGGGFSAIVNADTKSPSPFVFFHADVYPLYPLGGQWRNLGLMGEAGLGFPKTVSADTDETLIDGGGSSFVLAGVFWEGIQAWKIKMGPYLATHYMWSDSIRRPSALLGFRISLYTLP